MKRLVTLCLIAAWLPIALFGQSSKSKKGSSIHVATTFNFYPQLKPYKFVREYYVQFNDLELTYFTSTSGTFVIKEGDSTLIKRTISSQMPSQIVGVGASIQFKKLNGLFHEVSLTKLSFGKSSSSVTYSYTDTLGKTFDRILGYEENMFGMGIRYELGKYFGKQKDAKLRFGLSGGIETSYYRFKRRPYTSAEYPLSAKLLTIDLALIPMLSANLSKKLTLDFKIVPNFLTADFGTMRQNNPSLTKRQQGGIRNYKSPEITWAFSVLLRYTIKEAKKKKE